MASYLPISPLLLGFVFMIPSLFVCPPIVKATETPLIIEVCNNTMNSTYCKQALGSDPRSTSADLTGLCQVSIDLTLSNAAGSRNQISTLLNQTTDPQLKLRLQDCADFYDIAIDDLSEATDQLRSHDYKGVNLAGSAGIDAGSDCEDGFKKEPSFSSPLTKNNQDIRILGDILCVIANLLDSH